MAGHSLLDTGLSISPPAQLRWLHDVFGNSVLRLTFEQSADTLTDMPLVADLLGVAEWKVRRCQDIADLLEMIEPRHSFHEAVRQPALL